MRRSYTSRLDDSELTGCQDPLDEGVPWCFTERKDVEFEWCFNNQHLESPVFSVLPDVAGKDSSGGPTSSISSDSGGIQALQEWLYTLVDFPSLLTAKYGPAATSLNERTYAVLRNSVPDAVRYHSRLLFGLAR